MKRIKLVVLTLCLTLYGISQVQVDTISVVSQKMKKEIPAVVIIPEDYSISKHYPVIYLLHGYSSNFSQWVKTVPSIKHLSTQFQSIIVCPDGGYNSWYFDSPLDSTSQYETFVTKELIPYIDLHYSTISERKGRAITGYSMGGHGALYLAIRNKELFGSAGSIAGGVDLMESTKKFDIAKKIGTYENHMQEWRDRSVIHMISSLKNNELNLIIDCGVSDFFYDINADLHRRLINLKIDHDYVERPGQHDWNYCANSIVYQMLYFSRCFNK
jgi:S-formylglutathione hydrolase FrmB